jgi:ubiquinone/menaquinone biosynthesis C-methylase UbiE
MAAEIRRRFPSVTVVSGDCQRSIPYDDNYFDRIVIIHVLEHLPDLPAALAEIHRVLRLNGILSIVLPCDPGLAYELARKLSAERVFKTRYGIPYRWFARREHLNSPAEIFFALKRQFKITDKAYYPLGLPIPSLNLVIGVTARKMVM